MMFMRSRFSFPSLDIQFDVPKNDDDDDDDDDDELFLWYG